MNQQTKKPNRVERRRQKKKAFVMTPVGPRPMPSKGKLKKNRAEAARRLRKQQQG